jgi:hypothetical protein
VPVALGAGQRKLLVRLPSRGLNRRQLCLEHLPPRTLVIERSE